MWSFQESCSHVIRVDNSILPNFSRLTELKDSISIWGLVWKYFLMIIISLPNQPGDKMIVHVMLLQYRVLALRQNNLDKSCKLSCLKLACTSWTKLLTELKNIKWILVSVEAPRITTTIKNRDHTLNMTYFCLLGLNWSAEVVSELPTTVISSSKYFMDYVSKTVFSPTESAPEKKSKDEWLWYHTSISLQNIVKLAFACNIYLS